MADKIDKIESDKIESDKIESDQSYLPNTTKTPPKQYTILQLSLIYGFCGLMGNTSSAILYPLELIKIRLQGRIPE